MRVPTDTPLREWIVQLIRENRLYRFYKTIEWRALRALVLEDHHYECEMCAELGAWVRAGGSSVRSKTMFLARADTVHHEFEVRKFPHMALTRYVDEPDGTRREVLHPLCNDCHNEVHGRKLKGSKPKPKLNEERW